MAFLAGIVDSRPVYRLGLLQELKDHGFDVLELDGTHLRGKVQADVFLVGTRGPRGRELIRRTRAWSPDTPIVAIVSTSGYGPQQHAAVLADGAMAVVPEEVPRSVLASVVRAVMEDWAVLILPGEGIRAFYAVFCEVLGHDPPDMAEEELRVLQRLFQGATLQTLSEEFHFAPRTVDRRVQEVYRKLNASNRTDAIVRALLWGYLTSGPHGNGS